MREYDLIYLHVYPVGFTCLEIDKLIAASERGNSGQVRQLAERLREENAKLRHNAASWEFEARKSRNCVDHAPDSVLKQIALRSRVKKVKND